MELPKVGRVPRSNSMSKLLPDEEDPSLGSILFVIAAKMAGPMGELVGMEDRGGYPWKFAAFRRGMQGLSRENPHAFAVFRRVMRQLEDSNDGGPLSVYISNLEADDLKKIGEKIGRRSHEELASEKEDVKDEAMKWMAFGGNLVASVDRSIRTSAMQRK